MLKTLAEVLEDFAQIDSAGHPMIEPDPSRDDAELIAQATVHHPPTTDTARLPQYVRHS